MKTESVKVKRGFMVLIRKKKEGSEGWKRSEAVQYYQEVTMTVFSLARTSEGSKNFSGKDNSEHI